MSKYKISNAKELLDAGVHFGHQIRRWHPAMEPYIYGVKKNIHVIDLEETEKGLKNACEFLYETAASGGQIIFVGTKKQASEMVEIEAKRCGALYVTERWIGGTITNFPIVRKNMEKLVDNMRKRESGEFNKYTKKERLLIDREIEKLQRNVGGLVGLRSIPAVLFVIDARREKTAIKEAASAGVKVAGLVDTNTNPGNIDYIIPGNDDALKSIAIIIRNVANAIEAGYKEYAKKGAAQEAKAAKDAEKANAVKIEEEAAGKAAKLAETVILDDEKPLEVDL